MLVSAVRRVVGWLNLDDYKAAKAQATRDIVRRYMPGHQDYMTREELDRRSAEAVTSMARIDRMMRKAGVRIPEQDIGSAG